MVAYGDMERKDLTDQGKQVIDNMVDEPHMIDWRKLRTVTQAAKEVGVSAKTLRVRIDVGDLRSFVIGDRAHLVLIDEVEELSFREYPRG